MRLFLPKDSPLINALKCCANCNKNVEPFTLKMCPECRTAHYCNDDCQQADRENHQHQCNKDAEELKEMKEELKHQHNLENTDNDDDNDNELFQAIPPEDDCPLCTLSLPIQNTDNLDDYATVNVYLTCCGKIICHGCFAENVRVTFERGLIPGCAFCRAPYPLTDDESIIRLEKRMEMNDSEAIFTASDYYRKGKYGLPKDPKKEFDLCLRAADLGHSGACYNVALLYEDRVDVAKDMTKARKYYEKAAKKGNIVSRYNLGVDEWEKGNHHTAGRHWLISAAAGDADSLVEIAECYKLQFVTKEEYSTALTSYSNVHKDEWSIEREAGAAVAAAVAAADETRRQNSSSK